MDKINHEKADNTIPPNPQRNVDSRLPMNLPELFPHDSTTERRWEGPFSFVHAADPQLGLIEKHILKRQDGRWDIDVIHLKSLIRIVNSIRPRPKFLVIGGDMVDTPPYEDSLNIHIAQYQDFKECFQELDPEIKLICVCGNHDAGDVPTEETMEIYRNEFGPEYFSFWQGGVKFTVLNSQYFKIPEALPMNTFHQNEFLSHVKDENAVHSVIFQHIPLCIEDENEIDISFLNIDKSIRKKVIQRVLDAGIGYIFYGHTHRNGLSKISTTEQILTAAVGGTFDETKSGFRIVYVSESGISHEYIPLDLQFKEMDNFETLNEDMISKETKLKDSTSTI